MFCFTPAIGAGITRSHPVQITLSIPGTNPGVEPFHDESEVALAVWDLLGAVIPLDEETDAVLARALFNADFGRFYRLIQPFFRLDVITDFIIENAPEELRQSLFGLDTVTDAIIENAAEELHHAAL